MENFPAVADFGSQPYGARLSDAREGSEHSFRSTLAGTSLSVDGVDGARYVDSR